MTPSYRQVSTSRPLHKLRVFKKSFRNALITCKCNAHIKVYNMLDKLRGKKKIMYVNKITKNK